MSESIHNAIAGDLDDGELLVQWVYVADVIGPDGDRHIVTEGGSGAGGGDGPTTWAALGLLHAAVAVTTDQVMNPEDYADDA